MQVLAAIFFYFVFSLFAPLGLTWTKQLTDNKVVAYLVAKTLGFLVFALGVWLIGSLHIISFQNKFVFFSLFIIGIIFGIFKNLHFFQESTIGHQETKAQRAQWFKFFKFEILSLSIFLGYLLVRSHNADINGTERFMDMALLSASGKTDYFPPMDPWFSNLTVNYYYYGSYLGSVLANLSQIPYAISYNLFLGLVFTQSALLSGGLVYRISKSKWAATVSAFLLTCAGTLFYAGCSVHKYFSTGNFTSCSYASSTRLYTPSYIINEIPSYSFTVGDLHAHLLALPIFLISLFYIYQLAKEEKPAITTSVITALLVATATMTNTWDGVTLISVILILALFKIFKSFDRQRIFIHLKSALPCLAILGLMLIFLSPFLYSFKSPVLGIGFAPTYFKSHGLKDVQYPTPFLAILGMWGGLLLTILLCSVILFRKKISLQNPQFLVSLLVVSLGIIIGVELFFIKDLYSIANPPFFRANTTFKFGYHAWTMLTILLGIAVAKVWELKHFKAKQLEFWIRWKVVALVGLVTLGGLLYPYAAWSQFYNSDRKDLDGSKWLQTQRPDDFATINYINRNLKKREVIAEAVGDSYTHYARMASFTGMATPMGWRSHEWTWRMEKPTAPPDSLGNVETGWSKVANISGDVEKLYLTDDLDLAKAMIRLYKISYVYVGDLERETYPSLKEEKFINLGEVVFSSGNSRLYKISK